MSRGRLLITGRQLQNSLNELFALLNFICLEIFVDCLDLDGSLHRDDNDGEDEDDEEKSRKVVETLRKILRLLLQHRVRADAERNLLPSEFLLLFYDVYSSL